MHSAKPTPDQVCGRCAKFEPARHEPPDAPKYGYCKSSLERERSRSGAVTARLFDVDTVCAMAIWRGIESRPAFEAGGVAAS